jgi:hypothetical protein
MRGPHNEGVLEPPWLWFSTYPSLFLLCYVKGSLYVHISFLLNFINLFKWTDKIIYTDHGQHEVLTCKYMVEWLKL